MKKILFASILLICSIGCSSDDEQPNVDNQGDILVSYTHDIETNDEKRHTFTDSGAKFDKVFNNNGELIEEFNYNSNNQLRTVKLYGNTSLKTYSFTYKNGNIESLTIEESVSGEIISSEIKNYIHENNKIVVEGANFPEGIYKEAYTFNSEGKIIKIENYRKRPNFNDFEFYDFTYQYDNQGRTKGFTNREGFYVPDNDFYSVEDILLGSYSYFNDVNNPFFKATSPIYINAILAPELFNKGMFRNGLIGTAEESFLSEYGWAYDVTYKEYVLIREENLTVQPNKLPQSGYVGLNARKFEFTYEE